MAKKHKKMSLQSRDRVEMFLAQFAREDIQIREEIASSLAAYNVLLSMHAKSFEEFALRSLARAQGLPYEDPLFDYSIVKPICPTCGEAKKIRRLEENSYLCGKCKKKFAANHDSISSDARTSSLTWMKVLRCMMSFYTINQTCSFCNISRDTFYNIRSKLFYAMDLFLKENVALYGFVQVDNTFVRASYKGTNLFDEDYPEDSPFYEIDFLPRKARNRGGAYSFKDKTDNSICIFCAIDDSGHSFTAYAGFGPPTAKRLLTAVSEEKILKTVPAKDLCPSCIRKANDSNSVVGDLTILVSDGEKAIHKFAELRGLLSENHVYRRNNQQVKLGSGDHNIQRVNALHRRLKDFLRKCNFVSTKYLPGYLTFFDFLENTNGSSEALGQLFEIIAKPGMGQPSSFYQDLFTVPNYMYQHREGHHPLKKFSYNQLLACYLYHQKNNGPTQEDYELTMRDIYDQTNYTPSSIRRIYKNIVSAGLINEVCWYFDNKQSEAVAAQKFKRRVEGITPQLLAMYDAYSEERNKPTHSRRSLETFLEENNQKYGTSYKRTSFLHSCNRISAERLRPPLPPLNSNKCRLSPNPDFQEKYLTTYLRVEEMRKLQRAQNKNVSIQSQIKLLADKEGRSIANVSTYYKQGKLVYQQRKNQTQFNKNTE